MKEDQNVSPWFKQEWFWFLISIPLASVFLSSIMVYTAVTGKDSIVSDNYYKDGRGIEQRLELDRRADALNLKPLLTTADGRVSITLQQKLEKPISYLDVKLLHPTLEDRDIVLKLLPTPSGFSASLPGNVSGRHYIDVYAPDKSWRIRDEIILPASNFILNQD